jgi:nicotinate-nucleotide--dimethylbenzimidazole phosphoribosyltransferase
MANAQNDLHDLIAGIKVLDDGAMAAAEQRLAKLAKPPGSLGRLESLCVQLAGITGQVYNHIRHKTLLVFCADNGVVSEGVAGTPQSVTAAQTVNLTRGKTGAAVLAKRFGCDLRVCDVGVNADLNEPAVIPRKIAYGTKNIAREPAMTRAQALQAIRVGAELAEETVRNGAQVIGVGEMGIGNTTTSAAVLAVLTGSAVRDVAGRGAGLTDDAYKKKLNVIETAIRQNRPDSANVPDVLAKVGGLDIAAMCGAFLGAAKMRVPAVIDGFISAAAALCAVRLCPLVRAFLIPSHGSAEIGSRIAMDALGLRPMLDLDMRLGEGSGCPLAMLLLDAACAVMHDMATFDEAAIDDGYLEPLRQIDAFTVRGENA